MSMDISCAFATARSTPEHIALAEQLGYRRAWCYDSPGLYPDVWMILGLAAARTTASDSDRPCWCQACGIP
jgi:5,10-methylenetetrahydromethanopterin reductase